jgi:hypothetical protein
MFSDRAVIFEGEKNNNEQNQLEQDSDCLKALNSG